MIIDRTMNLVCFHYRPNDWDDVLTINALNEKLLHRINELGKIYLTHTKVNGFYTLRMVIGQTNSSHNHVRAAWDHIQDVARSL